MKYTPMKSASDSLSFDVTFVNQISKLNKNFRNNNSNHSSKLTRAFTLVNVANYKRVYCGSNVKSHDGWSFLLCHLSENECSEQASENFRKSKILRRQKFFVGNNFRPY